MLALISGYGRAGKRHGKILEGLGHEVICHDINPDIGAEFQNDLYSVLNELEENDTFPDVIVLCTPPDQHMDQIQICGTAEWRQTPYIICEKPLCSLSDNDMYFSKDILDWSRVINKIGVTYNYRFSDSLKIPEGRKTPGYWSMECSQYRSNLPEWGLLLDHVSHDVDILRYLSGAGNKRFNISSVEHDKTIDYESIIIGGKLLNDFFEIREKVWFINSVRNNWVATPKGTFYIDADFNMYISMWKDFIYRIENNLSMYPSYWNALETQKVLRKINEWKSA